MYELYPYFTNDGTVGLFSPQDDDIYHSTYGALTESWQKFILPSRLEQFVEKNERVRILDICYGIGYNTKTALNVFLKNYIKKNKKKIGKKIKNNDIFTSSIAPIYTDNILEINLDGKNTNLLKNNNSISINSDAIHTDNIQQAKAEEISNVICNEILIDAVDIDEILIELSPFIKINPKNKNFFNKSDFSSNKTGKNKSNQIKKIQNSKRQILKGKYKLLNEVSIIILEKLKEKNIKKEYIISKTTAKILEDRKFAPFWSKFMLNLTSFYQNQGYNYNKKSNKMAFLHNIYYRYISTSYKRAFKYLKNLKISLNLHNVDARAFIKSTDALYDFVFLDAFTPSKCPALWSVDFFREIYTKLDANGIVLTYSNSAAIRNAFLQSGFVVGKVYDKDLKKFVGTIAAKNEALIDNKLNDYDLGLINSRAGICYRDENLDLDNSKIIENRNIEVSQSDLLSSSKYIKGAKNVELL